jgi:arylsulfatase A-like enzyme/tetratricopeptide (TPR) repeat protein
MARPLLIGALIAVTMAGACRPAREPAATVVPIRHNILLVTIDTLRADRLQRGFTPTLDALASRSVSFANARTVAPLTLPAHASIMTGVLPPVHGVRLNGARLVGPSPGQPAPPALPAESARPARTLASRLKDAGYQTGAVVGAFVLDRRFGLDAGFEMYDDRIPRDPEALDRLSAERRAASVVDAAVAWLGTIDRSRPWLLWTHLYDPHTPYDPPVPLPASAAGSETERAYDGEIAYVDRELARLLTATDRLASSIPTAIVVAGDHGESLGEHGEPTHGMLLFEAALRVPLIVHAPNAPARRPHEAVSLVDIVPTALALASVAAHDGLSGHDLLGRLDADREIYAETEYPSVAGWAPVRALVQDRWKAISSARTVLFDLARDAGELTDLASTRMPLVDTMRVRMESVSKSATSAAPDATRVPPDAAERLRALGYISPRPRAGGEPGTKPRAAGAETSGIDPSTRIAQWAEFERALGELNAKESASALRRLQKLATANADAPLFQSTYARALTELGRTRPALDAYREAVRKWPADATLYHELAVAARATGQRDEAMRAEQASLALDAAQPAAHNGLGLLLADADRHDEAARAFAEAVKLDPTSAPYRANLGNARRAGSDLAGAADAYRQALERDPNLADAANGLGVVLVQQHRASEAIPWLERAIAVEPGFAEARLNLGIAWQETGNRARAADQYREVLATRGAPARERNAARALLAQLERP